jgi:small subunit ribosomal protein S2
MADKAIDVSLETLLESGAQFGHQYRRWNPKMARYMYAVKDGIYIFDLVKTHKILLDALESIKDASKQGKTILFVGTKKQAKEKVKEVAERCGCPYVSERWLGGTLTNFDQIRRSISSLNELEEKLANAKSQGYTKKERLLMSREIERMHKIFGGIVNMEAIPDFMIIVDTHREKIAVAEAGKKGIETVGIVDSNANPDLIDWPIPMNDDATKALDYVLELIAEAISGKKPSKSAKPAKKEAKDGNTK